MAWPRVIDEMRKYRASTVLRCWCRDDEAHARKDMIPCDLGGAARVPLLDGHGLLTPGCDQVDAREPILSDVSYGFHDSRGVVKFSGFRDIGFFSIASSSGSPEGSPNGPTHK